jgi:hypothetical protein
MEDERREFRRIDFDTSVQLLILQPYYKTVYMADVSQHGLRIITELDLELHKELTIKNIEIENSVPFQARVVWKKPIESGLFSYGLEVGN